MDYHDWITNNCSVAEIQNKNIVIHCPFHEDTHGSLSIERSTGRWKCFGCDKKGNLKTLAKQLDVEVPEELRQFQTTVNALPDTYRYAVDKAHERLMGVEDEVKERLHKEWDIPNSVIERLKLGWENDRLWIPIYYNGVLVNIRKYKFDAERSKVISIKGAKATYIYPMSTIHKNSDIMLVEGEKDTIVGLAHDIPCVTFTSGANTVPSKKHLQHFLHKNVWVCYDCDSAGEKGSEKAINSLKKIADFIGQIELPKKELGKGGDLTDFLRVGHTTEEFLELQRTAKQRWPIPQIKEEIDNQIYNVGLYNSRRPEWYGKRANIKARCIGKTLQPYSIPYKGTVDCMERGSKDTCNICAINSVAQGERFDLQIEELERNEVLSLIKCSSLEQKKNLSRLFGLGCESWQWIKSEHLNVEQIILTQDPLEEEEEEHFEEPPVYHEAYFVGILIMDENLTYEFVGRQIAEPKTQRNVHLFSKATTATGFLQGVPTDVEWNDLAIFQVRNGE